MNYTGTKLKGSMILQVPSNGGGGGGHSDNDNNKKLIVFNFPLLLFT